MSAPTSATLLAQRLHQLRATALQWLSVHYSALSFADAEDLIGEALANYYERLADGRVPLDADLSAYVFRTIQNLASKSMRHHGRETSGDDIDQERSMAYATEGSIEMERTVTSAETLLDEMVKLSDDCGDSEWKERCLEVANQCIEDLQEPCSSIVRCFYYHNFSMAEIAEEVGLKNADTAKAKKNQCMKRLIERAQACLNGSR